MELEDYLNKAIEGFENDPPDSDYQRGYLACLLVLREMYFPTKEQDQ